MRRYPVSGEINRSVENAALAVERARKRYEKEALAVDDLDGLSMDLGDWRFNLRSSNMEPLLRLNVESRGDRALLARRRDELLALIG